MTASAPDAPPPGAPAPGASGPGAQDVPPPPAKLAGRPWRRRPGLRLAPLYLRARRVPAALAMLAACAVALRVALAWRWDTYGALQLPLIFEATSAAIISVTTASPLGDPERVAGRRLPFLRLGTALALTAAAAGALAAAGTGAHLAGGTLDVLRNVAGLTGIGLLGAVVLGGRLAWAGPMGYLVVGVYALYTDWHGPALATPWIWAGRPPHGLGGALCAGLVLVGGLAATAVRGARDAAGE
jgi:hypothetical protein